MVYAAVGVAGALGAVLRYWLGLTMMGWGTQTFPLPTLLTNYIGCIALGWFTQRVSLAARVPEWLKAGISTGLIGAFTTFSAVSAETMNLLQKREWLLALLYVLLSLWGGLLLAWWGTRLAAYLPSHAEGSESNDRT